MYCLCGYADSWGYIFPLFRCFSLSVYLPHSVYQSNAILSAEGEFSSQGHALKKVHLRDVGAESSLSLSLPLSKPFSSSSHKSVASMELILTQTLTGKNKQTN